jgi:hypothetical protein
VVAQCRLKNISRFDRDDEIYFSGTIFAQRGLPVIKAVNATRFESSKAFFQQSITFRPSFLISQYFKFYLDPLDVIGKSSKYHFHVGTLFFR